MNVKVDWCEPIDATQSVYDSYNGVAVVVDKDGNEIADARIMLKGTIDRVNSGRFVLDEETGEYRKPRPAKKATKTSPAVPAEESEKLYFSVKGSIDAEIDKRAVYQHCVAKVHYNVDPTSPDFNWLPAGPPAGPGARESTAKLRGSDLQTAKMLAAQFGLEMPTEDTLKATWNEQLQAALAKAAGK